MRKWAWFLYVSVHVDVYVCKLRSWEHVAGYGLPFLVGEGDQWFFQGFPPNAKFIRSRRLILSPVGSPGECQISRESVYKLKAGVPLITQRSLLHPVYWISNAGAKTKNANMTLLPNTPTLVIHRGLRWKEQDRHQLLRLQVNHGMVVNKWTVMDLVFTALLCGLLFEACR